MEVIFFISFFPPKVLGTVEYSSIEASTVMWLFILHSPLFCCHATSRNLQLSQCILPACSYSHLTSLVVPYTMYDDMLHVKCAGVRSWLCSSSVKHFCPRSELTDPSFLYPSSSSSSSSSFTETRGSFPLMTQLLFTQESCGSFTRSDIRPFGRSVTCETFSEVTRVSHAVPRRLVGVEFR